MKSRISAFIVVFSVVLSMWSVMPVMAAPEAACTSTGTGNWNTASIWSCGHVPNAADDVIIAGGHTVRLNTSPVAIISLTVNGTFNMNVANNQNRTLSVTGNVNIAGTFMLNNPNQANTHTLNIGGNLTNNGTFTTVNGNDIINVVFNGAGLQNLTANTATTFNNLTVNNGVTLVETVAADNATVAGTLANNGTIRKSQNVAGTGARTFGLAGAYNGAALAINVTTQGTLSSLQVDRIDTNHPNATSGPGGSGTATGRYWNITPTGASYAVDLALPHNITPDTNAAACEYTAGPGDGWDCARTSSTGNIVTRVGVTALSPWAVGNNVGPTAVALESISAHTGTNGLSLLLAVAALLLSGSLVFTLARRKAH